MVSKRRGRLWALLGATALVFAFLGSVSAGKAKALSLGAQPLTGTFSIQPGKCSAVGPPSGSYVELLEHGVPVPNFSSPCGLLASFYTPLKSGTYGLVSGAYELDPVPTFDGGGNSVADLIVNPVKFLGVGFGLATTCEDQQHTPTPTGACASGKSGFPVPQLYAEPIGVGGCEASLGSLASVVDECIYGNLEAFGATYNGTQRGTCASAAANSNGCYDVGAATNQALQVTSCGSAPVGGCSLSGSLNPINSSYTLDIHSTIVGTSFNGAEAEFHLVGTFAQGVPKSISQPGQGSGSTPPGSTGSNPPPAGSTSSSPPSSGGRSMVGQFTIASGSCTSGTQPTGSWVQLGLGGSPIKNPDSTCDGGIYTLVGQGSQGLLTGQFQPNPTPTFDSSGNSLASAIIHPTAFLGSNFGAATDPQDEQTDPSGPAVFPVPQAVLDGTTIEANLSAVNFTYNGQPNGTCASGNGNGCYALGSPDVHGTYDPSTRAYTLQWTGTIHGGAFNNATATFHFSGSFNGNISSTSATLSTEGSRLPAGQPSEQSSVPVYEGSGLSGSPAVAASQPEANEMVGVFSVAAGQCAGATPSGSWVQLSKGGGPIPNPSSSCDGGNYTPVAQGTQGLETGQFQPDPSPTFDANGNSLADAIIKPTPFLGTDFGAGTDPQNMQTDPTGPPVFPAPYAVLSGSGTSFTANLSSVNFTYNGPPNGTCASGGGVGCYAVGSSDVQGSYDPTTHDYTMQWTGQVVGGAFNGATATFHLTGVFNGTITKVAASSVSTLGGASASSSAAGGVRAGSSPAFRPTPFRLAVQRSLPGSGPVVPLEEALSALVALVFLGFGLNPRLRRPRFKVKGNPG